VTHGLRDDRIRRTESGWTASETELAKEQIVTNTQKSELFYSGATNAGPEAKESAKSSEVTKYEENSYGRLETKPDESRETKSRKDAQGISTLIAPKIYGTKETKQAAGRSPALDTKTCTGTEVRTCSLRLMIRYMRPRRLNEQNERFSLSKGPADE